MKDNAILLTGGALHQGHAKTAHGLIRSSSRYTITGVIDKNSAGKDAGEVVDGVARDIPVYACLNDYLASSPSKASYAIIGVAIPGGKLSSEIEVEVKLAIEAGISIVSGLHDFLSDIPALKTLADKYNVQLIDIRKPRPKDQLQFWTGKILEVKTPIIGVLGTDCALGKRTTATMITNYLRAQGTNAHMIFTGQTGWLQGNKYGFILDSTYNDFISGELEDAIVSCYRAESPEVIFVEGQSALCNPSGPCGSEYLLSAQCKGIILQHSPSRIYYNGQEETGIKISLEREIALIKIYGAQIIAITLNTKGLSLEEALDYKEQIKTHYKVPVILPIEEGVRELAATVLQYTQGFLHSGTNA